VNLVKKEFQFGQQLVKFETGEIARQADGAVLVEIDGTVVLVTVVGKREGGENNSFFPLTVNYQEKTYAAGKIPGGFFKREGRPSEKETLTCRLIDRPIRPLFPKGYKNETQIIATVISLNPEVDPDIPALIGASAALAISGLPFDGPIGAARVGYINGEYALNPTKSELQDSQLDLVVAGTANAVLMVESEADCLSEDVMLGAVTFGHEQMQTAITAINELAAEAGKPRMEWTAAATNDALVEKVAAVATAGISDAYTVLVKLDRQVKLKQVRDEVLAQLADEDADEVKGIFSSLEKKHVRNLVLSTKHRIDGRDLETVRPIHVRTGVLPRAHGSALFTRGETQALVVATLGTDRDAQMIDAVEGEYRDSFMLHYNFPPFCVGETGFVGSPKRREIGHGRLAKRGMMAVLPSQEDFSYVLRVVAEVTESNGSSSMASTCGTSLALMDAGVPIKAPVAGIAMGLIKENNDYVVLSDILGDEDHLGDMDFKVAGTKDGITSLQMDIKITSITSAIMKEALEQAKEGRIHILGEMAKAIEKPQEKISDYAPTITTFHVHKDKIREVIGKGGAVIREISETTGAKIEIDDEGLVSVAAVDQNQAVMQSNGLRVL